MKATFFRRRFAVILSIVVASLVLAGTATLATLNLRHVHASGTGLNACFPSAGSSTCHFSGFTAYAQFNPDSDSCIYTSASIFVADKVLRDQPGEPAGQPFISVSIFRLDTCASGYTPLEDAYGTTTSVDIKHDAALGSASATATVPITDYYTQATSTVTIDLKWKGIGSLTNVIDRQAYGSGHFMFRTHFTGDSRAAVVSGTISEGTTNYAATPAMSYLYSTQGGALDIERQ